MLSTCIILQSTTHRPPKRYQCYNGQLTIWAHGLFVQEMGRFPTSSWVTCVCRADINEDGTDEVVVGCVDRTVYALQVAFSWHAGQGSVLRLLCSSTQSEWHHIHSWISNLLSLWSRGGYRRGSSQSELYTANFWVQAAVTKIYYLLYL